MDPYLVIWIRIQVRVGHRVGFSLGALLEPDPMRRFDLDPDPDICYDEIQEALSESGSR